MLYGNDSGPEDHIIYRSGAINKNRIHSYKVVLIWNTYVQGIVKNI